MATIDIVVLVVYILFINPVLYCLWKHGKPGILGWVALQSFALVRIIGSILSIHFEAIHSDSQTSLILSNIGLSPLLVAAAGILHEARKARKPELNNKMEWTKVICYHGFIIGSMMVILFGVLKEINDAPHTPNTQMKLGALLLLLAWCILVVWSVLSWFRTPQNSFENPAYDSGTYLLYAVLRVCPFIGVRLIYTLLSVFIKNTTFKNSTPAKVVLSVLPEMATTLCLVVHGIWTRNIGKLRDEVKA